MNAILSLFVCFAMLFAGGNLPAVPETATTETISNVSISYNGESVTLPHEFVLTTALGTEELAAEFHIKDDDGEILLPIAGVLSAAALDFSIADGENYISIPDSALTDSGIFLEEDLAEIDEMMDMLVGLYKKAFDLMENEWDAVAMNKLLMDELCDMGFGTKKYVQVEIGGEQQLAHSYSIDASMAGYLEAFAALRECGDPAVEDYAALMVDMYAMLGTEPFYIDSDAYAKMLEESEYHFDTILASGEDWSYMDNSTSFSDADGSSTSSGVAYVKGDVTETEISMQMSTGMSDLQMSMSGSVKGMGLNIEAADLEMTLAGTLKGMPDIYGELSDIPFAMELDCLADGAAWSIDGSYGENLDALDGSYHMSCTPGADGDSYLIKLPEAELEVSFTLKTEEAPYANPFEGKEAKLYDLSEESEAKTQLIVDALALSSDAMAFAADESVIALTGMFGDAVYSAMDDYFYEDYMSHYIEADSLEEAQQYFKGKLPGLTLPEGYELTSITVSDEDPEYLRLEYACGEKLFFISRSHYPDAADMESSEAYYELTPDGSKRKIEGPLMSVQSYNWDGMLDCFASLSTEDNVYYSLSFHGYESIDEPTEIALSLQP